MTTTSNKPAQDTARTKERRATPLPADMLQRVSGGYSLLNDTWF